MCSCRFSQSGGGTDSVAEATGGKVNAGYFCEGPTGERKTYRSVVLYGHKHIKKVKKFKFASDFASSVELINLSQNF